MLRKLIIYVAVLISGFFFLDEGSCSAKADTLRRVLFIAFQNQNHEKANQWYKETVKGVFGYFVSSHVPVSVEVICLVTDESPRVAPTEEEIARLEMTLQATKFDLIFVDGNVVTDLFFTKKVTMPEETPLIFLSYLPATPLDRNLLGPWVTGVTIPDDNLPMMKLGMELLEKTQKVVVITGADAEGKAARHRLEEKLKEYPEMEVTFLDGEKYSTEGMLEELRNLPEDVFLIFNNWVSLQPEQGEYMDGVYQKICEAYPGATFCTLKNVAGKNELMGYLCYPQEHGRQAGALAEKVLMGISPGDIPIGMSTAMPVFDYLQLKSYKLALDKLPREAKVLNLPDPFWERNHSNLTFLISILATLIISSIVFLLIYLRQIRLVEHIFRVLPVRIATVEPGGKIHFYRTRFPETEHRSREEDLRGEVKNVFERAVKRIFGTGTAEKASYTLEGRLHQAEFGLMPGGLFRKKKMLWVSMDVEELNQERQRYERLAKHFELVLESIGDGVVVTDAKEKVTLANSVAVKLFGYPLEKIVGSDLKDVFNIVSYVSNERVESPVHRALQEGRTVELSNHTDIISGDGCRYHIADSAAPIREKDGTISGAVMVFRDVTEEYKKRDRMQMQNEFLRDAADMGDLAYFRCDAQGRKIGERMPDKFWFHNEEDAPVEASAWVAKEDRKSFTEFWDRLLKGKSDVENLIYRAQRKENGDFLYFEIQVKKIEREGKGREFFGIIRDITKLKEDEKKIQSTHALLEVIIEQMPCMVFAKEYQKDVGRYVISNCYNHQVLGQLDGSMVGKSDFDVHSAELAKRYQKEDHETLREGKVFNITQNVTIPDGTVRTLQTRKVGVQREGESDLVVGFSIDITELMETQRMLQENVALLRGILDNLPCGLWVKNFDNHNRYVMGNRYYQQMLGLKEESLTGCTDFDFYPFEMAQKYTDDDRNVLEQQQKYDGYENIQIAKGRVIHAHTIKVPLENYREDGRFTLGITFDVSELIEKRNQLQESNALLKSIMNNVPCGLFVKDTNNDMRYLMVNQYFVNFFNKTEKDVIGKSDFELLPTSQEAVFWRKNDLEVLNKGQMRNITEELTGVHGEKFSFRCEKIIINGGEGRKLLLGVALDVTHLENTIKERQKLLEDVKIHVEDERMFNLCMEYLVLNADSKGSVGYLLEMLEKRLGIWLFNILRYDYKEMQAEVVKKYSHSNIEAVNVPSKYPFKKEIFWYKQLEKNGIYIINDVDDENLVPRKELGSALKSLRDFIRKHQKKTMVLVGIRLNNKLWGHLSFVLSQEKAGISMADERCLKMVGHIVEIILEQEQSNERLERSESEKQLIMDTLDIPLMLFDKNLKLVRLNNAACKLAGAPEEEILSKPCYRSFCGYGIRPGDCPVFLTREDGQPHQKKLRIGERDFVIRSYPIFIEGKLVFILKSLLDMTDANSIEQQLSRALLEAQNASKAKSYFLATMSHEIRTPLNAVIGYGNLLKKDNITAEERSEYLEGITVSGNSLLRLINDVLDISKIEAEQVVLTPKPTNTTELAREMCSIFQLKVREKGIRLVVECQNEIPLLKLDALRLRQILLNLTGNAVKFTQRGRVSIGLQFTPTSEKMGDLEIRVEDTGVGISPEYLKKIFQPFSQEDSIRDTFIHKGTGLGLAISYQLAIRMGGLLSVESSVGKGSTFKLILKNVLYLAEKNAELPQTSEVQTSEVKDSEFKDIELPGNILIVDDVAMNLGVLSSMLKKNAGIVPRKAQSGKEALKILENFKADLILTDIWMPEMDGCQLVKKIRKLKHFASTTIIAVTADTEVEGRFEMKSFDGIILKPVTIEKVKKLLKELENKK